MPLPKPLVRAFSLACLMTVPAAGAFAHGEVDEATLAEFHLHLDDFREEVHHLIEELDPIVAAHRDGGAAPAMAAELVEEWEEVGVHGVIEAEATPIYPTVWQALGALEAAAGGERTAELAAAAEEVKAALWQGFGAVRLAASQVESTATDTAAVSE
ncbi:MAG: hypothetical protein ACODAC_10005 [Pseudomonadota bacterium]